MWQQLCLQKRFAPSVKCQGGVFFFLLPRLKIQNVRVSHEKNCFVIFHNRPGVNTQKAVVHKNLLHGVVKTNSQTGLGWWPLSSVLHNAYVSGGCVREDSVDVDRCGR